MKAISLLLIITLLCGSYQAMAQKKTPGKKVEVTESEEDSEESYEEENSDSEEAEEEAEEVEEEASTPKEQTLSLFSKYDFVAGDKVVFFEDFSQDAVGDFPALWNTNASGEVCITGEFPGKWLKMNADGMFFLEKGFNFPKNFTLEFDVLPMQEESGDIGRIILALFSPSEGDLYNSGGVPGDAGIEIAMGSYFSYRAYDENKDLQNDVWNKKMPKNEVSHVSIWVQNSRLRLYALGFKLLDIPQALTKGFDYKQIRFCTDEIEATKFLISNIRVAEAGTDQRSKFLTDGKLISYGILFDVNSDKVKPESYGALKEMADILKENPSVRVKVVGHTDSDGNDATNLDLSKRRANSVKSELCKVFSVDSSRIETDGKGETEPIENNNTPLGKSKNRRVEFLKL